MSKFIIYCVSCLHTCLGHQAV